jgi:hypothetical protein
MYLLFYKKLMQLKTYFSLQILKHKHVYNEQQNLFL